MVKISSKSYIDFLTLKCDVSMAYFLIIFASVTFEVPPDDEYPIFNSI